jgi:hypothetical protein
MIKLSHHAILRGKERLSLNKGSFTRLVEKAASTGLKREDCRGRLKKYLDALYKDYEADNIRIFGEVIYFIKNDVLITLYQIPVEYKKWLKLK